MNLNIEKSAELLIDLAYREDLNDGTDVTSTLLIAPSSRGAAKIVSREPGIVCGLPLIPLIRKRFNGDFEIAFEANEGQAVDAGTCVAILSGNTIDLLKAERTILNFMGRLSGISTMTGRFCEKVKHTVAKIYDTRKTTPGWRLLEKYAVHQGGGTNHRMGLYDAILIKDNHLAAVSGSSEAPAAWLEKLRSLIQEVRFNQPELTIQIEVDTLEQLEQVLTLRPDIVLLDNMSNDGLKTAVQMRGQSAIELEASGGVNLQTVQEIAETQVDRISVGALTHSAVNFDWGLDWG